MKFIYLITILLMLISCSVENENVNNINQPNGTIVTDNRGPQLRTIENELYKKLKEEAENEEKKIKTAQKKDTVRNGSYSQK
ncbi:MAG TPA: hypothetical protein PKG96_09800 [Bacilli bacterium]|mgnify:CR=1 FL=1|jgi:hypothetical protein|nr:hypothetical protein [Bacilli bacterium]HOH58976.1 hypothetical protein [Bacilli bacterium]HQM07569.1 hypothetical protein [Bacilli bacterium]